MSQDPRPNAPPPDAPRPDAPRPDADPAAVGETYALPVGLSPLTNRNTCRHAPRDCCAETKDWCLAEGFVWRDCKTCYCGSQCLAPGLFKD
ncbi:MAG TPA: hypothetical protein VFQ07_08585 [Candidatus Polarisedimenticolia bacterium]|nr:hypothetical protein [Candidatus Polarisedimenticolia bacterium]